MTDYDQIAQGCVSPVLLAAINERKEQYIYEGYVRWGLVERHIIEHVAAALRAAHAAGVAVERERCAGIADEWASIEMTPQYIAAQIRQGE